jgi:hypothetical protein
MNRDEVTENVGALVYVTGERDLAIERRMRKIIRAPGVRIVGLTKGGMAILSHEDQEYQVPPSQLVLVEIPSDLVVARRLAERAVEAWRNSGGITKLILLPWQPRPEWMDEEEEERCRRWAG